MTRSTWTLILTSALALVAVPAHAANGALGDACATSSECASGHCVDGACCHSARCNDCQRCDRPDNPGYCSVREPGSKSPSCAAGYVCNGVHDECKSDCHVRVCDDGYYCTTDVTPLCRPQLALGAGCASECPEGGACEACGSGHCVDGVCCSGACDGDCVACTRALKGQGRDGDCGTVAAAEPGRRRCTRDPAPSCMRTGVCDGDGECAFHARGTLCGKNLCVEDIEIDLKCDGQGQCAPHISKECGGGCVSDAGCAAPVCADASCKAGSDCGGGCDAGECDGGACGPESPSPCASDGDCQAPLRCDFDGRCVDPREVVESPSACAIHHSGARRGGRPSAWTLLGIGALAFALRQRSAGRVA